MRIPNRILEHPVEATIACLLLLALLFVSSDPSPAPAANATQVADSQKL